VILQLELAKAAQNEGIHRIDLGRGANRMKLSLKSGSTPLAIGSVERRPLRGVWTAAWYGLRALAHTSPLGRGPLRVYRRLRGMLAGG
jgi:CelD/BcsL family acetyltransferase involved in cellulose biosynthesis